MPVQAPAAPAEKERAETDGAQNDRAADAAADEEGGGGEVAGSALPSIPELPEPPVSTSPVLETHEGDDGASVAAVNLEQSGPTPPV